jgi:Spy/CpxP family protein refolding chaperone
MKRNFLLSVMVGLFLTGGLMAQDPPTGGPPQGFNPQDMQKRMQARQDTLKKQLNLNKDQIVKFDAIYKEYNEKMAAARENAGDDREGMRAKMQEMSKDRDAKIEKMLTPDQVKKWKDYQAKQAAMRQQRGQGGPPGGGQR